MEQVQANQVVSLKSQYQNWIQQRCRQMVFNILGSLDFAHLKIIELGKEFNFGQQDSELKAVIEINDPNVYAIFVKKGSIGAAEAYIDQQWSSPNLTQVIRVFARGQSQLDALEKKMAWLTQFKNALFHKRKRNSQQGSKKNILAHYDLGNDLYTRFLDQEMMYSAAIYPQHDANLEQAQLHKLDTICQRLELKAGEHLIEIGTGWGGMAIYAAKHYGVHVTTTTISDAQYEYAKARIEKLGLTKQITLLKKDYRELNGQFDKLVSIEMIEAVGYQYLPTFFKQCNALLKPQGKMLIQAITIADQRFDHYLANVDFIQRYIFPGGFLPSVTVMTQQLTQHTNMVSESLHDIGLDYAKTLQHWFQRFNANWLELKQFGYGEDFKRLWNYYLCYCEGAFLERAISTVHWVARKPS
ncbi:SAM-dependent methyltransferase [Saccharobesus litoralis]|uniref:SAM-dependent methyltransferase n=1 Tax=Saccharobesus litoralis TaxID=2172099 RepID=A0A2S0VMG0_9ALTE|nr:cyclopropane-fatty-acyl-phospholipid synthase family protein [Saccharobesus litoralis]AWB65411.1 SAM-dependent methyltransferase [Saccharobesus litoralis]